MIVFKAASKLYLLSFILSVTAVKNVPVLFWETSLKNSSNGQALGLVKLSTPDFLKIFDERLLSYDKLPLVLVFAEEKLSVEDFGWKDDRGKGSFPQLKALTNRSASTTFFPSVSEPVKGLMHTLSQHGFKIQTKELNATSSGKQCDMESAKRMDLANSAEELDKSIESSPTKDQDAFIFPDQNLDMESTQSLDVNTEMTRNKDRVSKSTLKMAKSKESEDGNPMLKAYVFRLSSPRPGESRPSVLRRHDSEIALTFAAHSSRESEVISVYSALAAAFCFPNNKLRRRRQDPDPEPQQTETDGKVWGGQTSTILIYFHKTFPSIGIPEPNVTGEVISGTITSDNTPQYLRLLVKGTVGETEVDLGLCFSLTGSNWELAKVEMKDSNGTTDLLPTVDVVATKNYSFTCRGDVVFTDGIVRFTMADFQMQAFMNSSQFSPAQDCVSYFSIGIWSGIIVVFVMFIVLGLAITMIMDIKINDKMDNRLGKTINVGAGN